MSLILFPLFLSPVSTVYMPSYQFCMPVFVGEPDLDLPLALPDNELLEFLRTDPFLVRFLHEVFLGVVFLIISVLPYPMNPLLLFCPSCMFSLVWWGFVCVAIGLLSGLKIVLNFLILPVAALSRLLLAELLDTCSGAGWRAGTRHGRLTASSASNLLMMEKRLCEEFLTGRRPVWGCVFRGGVAGKMLEFTNGSWCFAEVNVDFKFWCALSCVLSRE